jgi:hypothetical protein
LAAQLEKRQTGTITGYASCFHAFSGRDDPIVAANGWLIALTASGDFTNAFMTEKDVV